MTPGEITGRFPCYQDVDMTSDFLPGFKLSTFSPRALIVSCTILVHNLMILKLHQLVLLYFLKDLHQHL